jgi:LCP family protein required for cell wall assembly
MEDYPNTPRKPKRRPNFLVWFLLLSFLVFALLTAYLAFSLVQNAVSSAGIFLSRPDIQEPISTQSQEALMDVSNPLHSGNGPPPQPWDGQSQVNLLLLGVDHRDWEVRNGPPRADTIILATIDPQTQTAGMLSIPRDLWVDIPGYGYNKINQAYPFGEINQEPEGGAGLAIDTVEGLFGIHIPYYVEVDFNTFVRLVDEIGGVKINVPEAIQVDPLGDHNTRILQPGVQTLPGEIALAYVRNRDTLGSDFDRAVRQQQVIVGIQERLISFELLPSLIPRAPILYKEIASGIKSNLTLQQAVQISWLTTQIPRENIQQIYIGPEQVINAMSWNGMSILQPIPEEILAVRDKLFSSEPPENAESAKILPEMSLTQRVEEEDALVSLRNGTFTPGLAARTGEYLADKSVNILSVSNADQIYDQTTIINYSGKPYTLGYLADILSVPPGKIFQRYDPNSKEDILVILGEDWAADNDLP